MPEAPHRRATFLRSTNISFGPLFTGARQRFRPTWVSTGLSYSMLASIALRSGLKRLAVAEDDCVFPPDFDTKSQIVEEYLDGLNDTWDMFSGLIADLHPAAKILSVAMFKGVQFVTIDKMTSMVYNIYNQRLLSLLSAWDAKIEVDRYIEQQRGLNVVVMLPFLVGHRSEVRSTLWGYTNDQIAQRIHRTEQMLLAKLGTKSSGT
eukprot:TRINITY_DN18497_c0_g1_i4.p1 TRINITY_DN18497_c0_g1~~TRINITY_DN18497_c0_g1_i4.p1  ORF type:complete len:237 (+),score=12.43 TRINITY_DN18497_c0_g1_i4:95-712(+)